MKLEKLVDINEVGLEQLLFWNETLKKEINERIKDTLCPYCHSIIGEPDLKYCNRCGGRIEWIWEE